ncbi:MAG: DUF1552 domain-containing protein [Pirellulaceae bacterium]|nr:DUF1552 domain-containing protein [Pirellulaceae bacterium]
MTNRRDFLTAGLLSAGAVALLRSPRAAAADSRPPMRFVFLNRGNGLFPHVLPPPSFDKALAEKERKKEAYEVDLDGHALPEWMSPLEPHKNQLTILQGLSGKMCTYGHHGWCSALGVFKANERLSSIKWATVDFELARLFPAPVPHIELACFPNGGGNARGTLNGIATGFSARGPEQPNFAFGSPRVALEELFKSVSENKTARLDYELGRMLLDFTAGREGGTARQLTGVERAKIQSYADSLEAVREQTRQIEALADNIRRHVPELDPKYLAENVNTLDRQSGHVEVLLGALISGLTNVVSFTVDELGHDYTGIPGIEGEKVNMHDIGHGKAIGGVAAEEVRRRTEHHHMKLMDRIATRLKAVPEGTGTMFDNTLLCYFPNSGETHHAQGIEYPFIVLAGDNAKINLHRRYIRLPGYGQAGHKTLGNWYTTLLNAYGNPIEHYGALDVGLKDLDQRGPIKQFLA